MSTPTSTGLSNNFWQTTTPATRIKKARGQVVIPALGYSLFTTCGVPFIVAQYSYSAPNNFCLWELPATPAVGSNYNLAIRYNDPVTGAVNRYKIWNLSNDSYNDIPAPLYTSQPIYGGNFIIEVWSIAGNINIAMPLPITLNTSVRQPLMLLTDPETFQLGTSGIKCSSLFSINGLKLPLEFLPCASGFVAGSQQGYNYVFNTLNGMLEIFNILTGYWNGLYLKGGLGAETFIITPPIIPSVSNAIIPPNPGANYVFDVTSGDFMLFNPTTGVYNSINSLGLSGVETLIIRPWNGLAVSPMNPIQSQGNNYRFNTNTSKLEILNTTTSEWNAFDTIGIPFAESLVVEPQDT